MNYCVETITIVSGRHQLTHRTEGRSYNDCLTLAQEQARSMFPEDPMSIRTFRAGRVMYVNRNDLGDLVMIRPMAYDVPLDQLPSEIIPVYVPECRRPDEPA